MWYTNKHIPNQLDYTKPIIAKDVFTDKHLLLPQIDKGSYLVIGYNWFNLSIGAYNSCVLYETAQKAVEVYEDIGHKVYNSELITK